MGTRLGRRILTSVVVAIVAREVQARPKEMSVEALRWLAGCWERAEGERLIEEQWMEPRGGTMLGMSRTVKGGATVMFETMRIEEREESLVFTAKPRREPETSFPLTEYAADEVVFTNRKHDFPQRIVYGRATDGSLAARIEGKVKGTFRQVDFSMKRVPCATGAAR